MSVSVDNRVVEMRFDNAQFERGIHTSINSLDSLKKGLKLEDATKGLDNLQKAGNSFSLGGITNALNGISEKFSALGIIGITTLQNLTNTAVNAGKRMISALTVDPIKMGFEEYETKMNAIQTILTNTKSKGTTIDQVNTALAELNTYADKTIYDFSEMTRNIGTFTAAGVALKTSVTSIKGIANLAAGSGSSAQQASVAMYQLSQAIAAGSVKLMDWNSVVNAGMGGELFQKALEKTAKELGHGRDMSVSFRESLESGWITTEVLTKTLEKFANDESLIKAATQVKTFTQLFDTMKESVQSGWATSWENIIGNKDEAAKSLTALNDAFGSIIGPSTDARNAMLKFWHDNGGRDALIQAITNAFQGLSSIIKPVSEAFKEVFPPMTGKRLVEITKGLRDLTENFKIGDGTANAIKTSFKGLFSVLDIGVQVVTAFVKGFATLIGVVLPAGDGVLNITAAMGSFLIKTDETIKSSGILNTTLETLGKILKKIPDLFGGFDKISEVFANLSAAIGKAFGSIQLDVFGGLKEFNFDALFAIINGGLFATILLGVKKFIGSLTDIVESGGGFLSGLKGMLDGVRGCLEAYQTQLKAGTLLKIAGAIALLAGSLVVLASIDPKKMASAIGAITLLFGELLASMAIFDKVAGGMGFKSMITITTTMLALSTAILILSAAMTVLSKLDWNGIAKGLIAVAGLSAILIASSKLLSTTSGQLIKSSVGFILFATALSILANAVKTLGEMNIGELTKGLIGIAALAAGIVLFMKVSSMDKMGMRTGAGILLLATGLTVLAQAVKMLGSLDDKTLVKGLGGIGVMLAEIILFMKLTGNSKNMILTAVGLTILSTALIAFSAAVGIMGSMSLAQLAKGLGALAASLVIMGVAMKAMKTALPGAAALLVMAAAIAIFAPALVLLSSMSLSEIGKSLLALVGVFVILGGTAIILAPLTPALLALGATIALLGVGCLAVGVGILALATGLTALAATGAAASDALVRIVTGLIGLIPMILTKFGDGIIALAKVIGDGAPVMITAAVKLIMALIDALVINIPKIVTKGAEMIVGLLEGIASKLPKVIQAGFDLIISFINGLANAIRKNSDRMIAAGENLIDALIDGCWSGVKSIGAGFKDVGKHIVDGIIEGIKGKTQDANKTADNLGQGMLAAMKSGLAIHSPSRKFKEEVGAMIAEGVAEGIKEHTKSAKDATTKMSKEVFDTAKQWIDDRKYYNKISLEEELYVWQEVQKKYIAETEERKQADKEVYRVKQEQLKASYDTSVKWIDNEKYYNRMSLAQELAAWERVQARYQQGTEERKQADKEVYRVKQAMINAQKALDEDYYSKTKEINDKLKSDIKSVNDEYQNAIKSRADTLYNSYGLFDKVGEKEDVSGQDLITNLQGQVDQFELWQQNITELSKKGIDDGLLQELRNMGPESLAQIQALNTLTVPELDMYVSLWQTKSNDARNQAISELEGMKADTKVKIAELREQARAELAEYRDIWRDKTRELRSGVNAEMSQMTFDVGTAIDNLSVQTQNQVVSLNDNLKATFAAQDWVSVGSNIITGILQGINNNYQRLLDRMTEIAKAALRAARQALDINSPSGEFEKVGMYVIQGFVNGLDNFSNLAIDASTNVGNAAIDSFKATISNLYDVFNGNVDFTPTITPVLDLSNVESGTNTINSLFGATQGINVTNTSNKAESIAQGIKSNVTSGNSTNNQQTQGSSIQFVQNNYSPKALSRLDIYRQTKNQFSALKGLVTAQ